jgi:anti-anti-sigma regulatory factor
MTDMLEITKMEEGRITILHFDGSLDGQTENLAVESARTAKNAGARFLVINMSRVEMVTSAGLRALHTIFKLFTPQEEVETWKKENTDEMFKSPYFKLSGASSEIQYVLSITGFLENISIYSTLQEALASFPA